MDLCTSHKPRNHWIKNHFITPGYWSNDGRSSDGLCCPELESPSVDSGVINCISDTAKEISDADYLEILGKGWDVAVFFSACLLLFLCRDWQNMKPLLLSVQNFPSGQDTGGKSSKRATCTWKNRVRRLRMLMCVMWRVHPLWAGVCWCLVNSRRGRSRSPQALTATNPRRCSFCLSPCISASCLNDGGMMPSMSSFLRGVDLPVGTGGGGGLHRSTRLCKDAGSHLSVRFWCGWASQHGLVVDQHWR